jgi:hypothetical protein
VAHVPRHIAYHHICVDVYMCVWGRWLRYDRISQYQNRGNQVCDSFHLALPPPLWTGLYRLGGGTAYLIAFAVFMYGPEMPTGLKPQRHGL